MINWYNVTIHTDKLLSSGSPCHKEVLGSHCYEEIL